MLTQEGMLGSVEVYFFEDGIANIISLAKIKEKYPVTVDSHNNNEFIVHLSNKHKVQFQHCEEGLYYHGMAKGMLDHSTFSQLFGNDKATFIDTVDQNKRGFTK